MRRPPADPPDLAQAVAGELAALEAERRAVAAAAAAALAAELAPAFEVRHLGRLMTGGDPCGELRAA
jgi:hypothetical protein